MKTKVSKYKGFDIFFNDINNMFQTESENWNQGSKSFTAIKKKINDFIKENDFFGEFEIVGFPNSYSESKKGIITVKGIHANNNFLCEDSYGNKFQINTSYSYDMEKYCFPIELAESEYSREKVEKYEEEIKKLKIKIDEEEAKLPEDVSRRFKILIKEKQELRA